MLKEPIFGRNRGINIWIFFSLVFLLIVACRPTGKLSDLAIHKRTGKFIALVGISGSGKSTLARELALITGAKIFLEPEEKNWPEMMRRSHIYGEFAAMSSLRNVRVKNLYDARVLKNEGHLVIVDSYYDKITSYYLEKPGMEWLISPSDPYFQAAKLLTSTDTEHLPDADCLVLLDINRETWNSYLKMRNRERDSLPGFQESFSLYKNYIEEAALKLSRERNIRLIRFTQVKAPPKTQAALLRQILIKEKVLEI